MQKKHNERSKAQSSAQYNHMQQKGKLWAQVQLKKTVRQAWLAWYWVGGACG